MNTENNDTPPPPPAPAASEDKRAFHLAADGVQQGPYSLATLKQMHAEGSIVAGTVYWTQGMTEWKPVTELLDPPIATPPPAQTAFLNAPAAQEENGNGSEIALKAMNAVKEKCMALNAKGIQFSAAKMLAGLLTGAACGLLVGIIGIVSFQDALDSVSAPVGVLFLLKLSLIVLSTLMFTLGGAVVSLFPMTEKPKRRASIIAAIAGGALGFLFAMLTYMFDRSIESLDFELVLVSTMGWAIMLSLSGLPLGYVLHKIETNAEKTQA